MTSIEAYSSYGSGQKKKKDKLSTCVRNRIPILFQKEAQNSERTQPKAVDRPQTKTSSSAGLLQTNGFCN